MQEIMINAGGTEGACSITLFTSRLYDEWLIAQDPPLQDWLTAIGYEGEPGHYAHLPAQLTDTGEIRLILCVSDTPSLWDSADLPFSLPEGNYRFISELPSTQTEKLVLGWLLGGYHFARYRPAKRKAARLIWPDHIDRAALERQAEACWLARDLINTPAEDMGPAELARASEDMVTLFGGVCRVIVGDALIKEGWQAVHRVGRASITPPRLIDLRWIGNPQGARLTLVGKGVCFDSGGLDLKSAAGMLNMKKDMGGAACVLALAHMIMDAELPVKLRVLIPAVENSVSGNAFRPMDIIPIRNGMTVEVGNTDAEGRLILADALAEAAEEQPDLLIDMATLTGARLVALGPDIPAFFSNDDALATQLVALGEAESDPLWRLPLYTAYQSDLESRVADLNNIAPHGDAGAIIAALFLQKFIGETKSWIHVDLTAWNKKKRPGRPEGGEAQAIRALFSLCQQSFPNQNQP